MMLKIQYTGLQILLLLLIIYSVSEAKEYNVTDFGARPDGKTLVTHEIQKAIDEAAQEGGVVVFPSGKYLTGTIYLKSNITLRLEKGAIMLGSTDLAHYPENLPNYNFFRKGVIKRTLFYAENLENITLMGEGTIDGQGSFFKEPDDKSISSYSVRPYIIWMIKCKNVKVKGLKLQNSALWMQHYLACENLFIHDIEVYNHSNKNNDMMDIDGCKDVIISDCRGDTDDDGITLKSTHAQPNENITITNCLISSHCNAIKCGTESNAGFKNITISNCVIRPSKDRQVIYGKPDGISGISLEVVDGAEMNGVNISNIIIDGPAVPLFVRLGNRARGYDKKLPKPSVGSIQNISISNITAFNAGMYGSSITGIPGHRVKNVSLENIRIFYSGGGSKEDASKEVEEKIRSYPEATMFGKLPSYGMFIRHAEHISISNIQFHLDSQDYRSAFFVEDINNLRLRDAMADLSEESALITMKDIYDIYIQNPVATGVANSAIDILGKEISSIRISDIDKSKFKDVFTAAEDVKVDEIKIISQFE